MEKTFLSQAMFSTLQSELESVDVILTIELFFFIGIAYYSLYGFLSSHFPSLFSWIFAEKVSILNRIMLGTHRDRLVLPKKVFLVRHGQSLGNVQEKSYETTPDWAMPLTAQGKKQALEAGLKIKEECGDTPIIVYFSPYKRTKETMKQILRAFPHKQIYLVQQEPRIREQDFGNFQNYRKMKLCKKERLMFSRFFYRFPSGESGADVYDRVSSFMESLFRLFHRENNKDFNLIIVSHGLTIRVILMRWFRWTVQEFETMVNPRNAKPIIMERKNGNKRKYRLRPESWSMLHSYTFPQKKEPTTSTKSHERSSREQSGNQSRDQNGSGIGSGGLRFSNIPKSPVTPIIRRQSYTRNNLLDILHSDTETEYPYSSPYSQHVEEVLQVRRRPKIGREGSMADVASLASITESVNEEEKEESEEDVRVIQTVEEALKTEVPVRSPSSKIDRPEQSEEREAEEQVDEGGEMRKHKRVPRSLRSFDSNHRVSSKPVVIPFEDVDPVDEAGFGNGHVVTNEDWEECLEKEKMIYKNEKKFKKIMARHSADEYEGYNGTLENGEADKIGGFLDDEEDEDEEEVDNDGETEIKE